MTMAPYSKYQPAPAGWIGEVPEHWDVEKIKFSLAEKAKVIALGLPAGAISYGRVVKKDSEKIAPETLATYQEVRAGEFLINPINLNYDLVSLRTALANIDVVVSPAYIVLRGNEAKLNKRFANYLLYIFDIRHMKTLGAGIRQTIGFLDIGNCLWALPPLHEQNTIGNYLDLETARIERLVERKNKFIELLQEKHTALISRAVGRGLNAHVKMKSSQEAWLGDIPAHWSMVPPAVLFDESKQRALDGDPMLSATQKYGVIPLAEFEALEQRQVTMAVTNLEKRKHVEIGDFVISMRSMDGGLERARAVGSVRSSYTVLKPGNRVEGRFFGALLKSKIFIEGLRLTSNFIRDGQDLNFSHLRKLKLPLPPFDEQVAIADYIERETALINNLVTKTKCSIELLKEHRSALITAAVTGKIDVRTHAPQKLENAA